MDNKNNFDFKDINLNNKNEQDTYELYSKIADDLERQQIVWNETKDYENSKKVYSKYLEQKGK